MKEWITVALMVLLVGALIAGFAALSYYADQRECRLEAEAMSLNWRYDGGSGCSFEVEPGKWVLDEYYRYDAK